MIKVTLQCNRCSSEPVSFASGFKPRDTHKIKDTQYHIDTQFLAPCGKCGKCDWQVTDVMEAVFVSDRN